MLEEERKIQEIESKLFCKILERFHHFFVTEQGITIDTYRLFIKEIWVIRGLYLIKLDELSSDTKKGGGVNG